MSPRGLIGAAILAASCLAGPAQASCRQALAIGMDVSGSVDTAEYRVQLDGLAAALTDPEVRQALVVPGMAPVRLLVFEWSGPNHQRVLLDWTEITGPDGPDRIANRLRAATRVAAPPTTAVGDAMVFGAAELRAQPDCWRRALDLSGDGRHNAGRHPRAVKHALQAGDPALTVNGLVIGGSPASGTVDRDEGIAALSAYYHAWVTLGPGAFVETALGFEDFQRAMTRKLLRELQSPALAGLSPREPGSR